MADSDLPHWDASLDRTIMLRDGRELRTLREASVFLAENLGWSRGIIYAAIYRRLKIAAGTGEALDISHVQHLLESLLEAEQMI